MRTGQLFTGSITTFITRIATFVLNLVTLILIARILGPKNTGLYVLIGLIPATLSSLGAPAINLSNVYLVGKGTFSLKAISGVTLILSLSFSAVLVGLSFAATLFPAVQQLLQAKEITIYHYGLAAATLPAALIFRSYSGILRGAGKITQLNLVTFLSVFIQLVIMLILWVFSSFTLTAVIWSFVLSNVIVAVITFIMAVRLTSISLQWDGPLMKELIAYGTKAYFWNAVYFLDNRTLLFIVGLMIGPAELGFYSTAMGIAEKLWFLTEAVATVLFPFISSQNQGADSGVRVTTAVSRYTFYSISAISLILGVLASPLIRLMFGSEYMNAVLPFQIVLVSVSMLSVTRLITIDFAARGKPEMGTLSSLIDFVVTIGMMLLLVTSFGINGVAFANTFGYLVAGVIMVFLFSRKHQISPWFVFIPERSDGDNLRKMVKLINTKIESVWRLTAKGYLKADRK